MICNTRVDSSEGLTHDRRRGRRVVVLQHIDRLERLRATWQLVHTAFVRDDDPFGADVVEDAEIVEDLESARLRIWL